MRRNALRVLPDRSRMEIIAMLIAGVGFALVGGLAGVASALTVGIVWLLLPAVYAVALGYVLLTALTVSSSTLFEFIVVGFGLFAVLLAPTSRFYRRKTLISVTVFAAAALFSVFAIAFTIADTLWIEVLALIVTWALAVYGIHRYELVVLGIVEGSS